MKSFMKSLIVAIVLCGAVNTVVAEITCYPGIKIYSPGAGDEWICWDGYSSNCLNCHDDVIVKG
jgi:hypothetical protein